MEIFQAIYDFITVDIYQFVVDSAAYLIQKAIVFKIKSQIWLIGFSWDIASSILNDLALGPRLNSALSAIPLNIRSNLEFFNVFTGLTWIMQAFTTRFVMKFIGV